MGFRCWLWFKGLGLGFWGFGFGVGFKGLGLRVLGFRFGFRGFGFAVSGSGLFGIWGSGVKGRMRVSKGFRWGALDIAI